MYNDGLDNYISETLDNLYDLLSKEKIMKQVSKEKNFITYQKNINEIIYDYYKNIQSYEELKDILLNDENTKIFDEMIKRYIVYYVFLFISSEYKESIDTFSNNVVEFSKNQLGYKFKVNNFFNSDTNYDIIQFFKIIKTIDEIINTKEENKLEILESRYKQEFEFVKSLQNKDMKNIIKSIIIEHLYLKKDKRELFNLIENTVMDDEEYTYIEISLPIKENIDYTVIEDVFTIKEKRYVNEFWEFIKKESDIVIPESNESKILKLINSRMIIPIVDDFLLYHKESEKYEKTSDIDKKKEETKIKYIIYKIDKTSELYSAKDDKTRELIKKNFYAPLMNRKAILVNNNEDVKIITKVMNLGRKALESNENFNDFAKYRIYPYINFKDFKNNGFTLQLNKTVPVIRAVSFDKDEFKQNKNSFMQMRVGSKDEYINIVGFMIPSSEVPPDCHRLNDIKNIHNYANNGYKAFLEYITLSTLRFVKHKSSVYWMFNLNRDIIKSEMYEKIDTSQQEETKKLISNFYDDLLTNIYDEISRKLNIKKEIYIQNAKEMLFEYENRFLKISDETKFENLLDDEIFDKLVLRLKQSYDTKEDLFYGYDKEEETDVIKLPTYTKELPETNIFRLDVSPDTQSTVKQEIEKVNGICQHNISWDEVLSYRRDDPKKYEIKMYRFIQKFVTENNEQDFICKSCSTQLDLKKYIIDGAYNDDTKQFVSFYTPFDTPLDEIEEYSKYKVAINRIDKLIEKIALITNISMLIGNNGTVRSKRKNLTKDLIDLVIENNYFLKKNQKERKEKTITRLYGVSKELSGVFGFDFDNNIFLYSSKEKDLYKDLKFNNILTYLLVIVAVDLGESQMGFMLGDKKSICNFNVFDKYGFKLFENLNIIKNTKLETDSILNYKILCYIIYIISCMMVRYSVWNHEEPIDKKTKFNPMVQKMIIHTTVDLLNNILENSTNKKANIIFEIISAKFYKKLNTFFNDKELYDRLQSEYTITAKQEQRIISSSTKNCIPIIKYTPIEYDKSDFNKTKNAQYNPIKQKMPQFYNSFNIITNCESGLLHQWKSSGKDMKCKLCNKILQELENEKEKIKDKSLSMDLYKKYVSLYKIKISKKYCIAKKRQKHKIIRKNNMLVCKICGLNLSKNLTEEAIDKIIISRTQIDDIKKPQELSIDPNIEKDMDKNDPFDTKSIDNFIKIIQDNILETFEKKVYFYDNVYVINHDYMGKELQKPIVLSDKDNKIQFKNNHPYFKSDVIYYTITKSASNKIDVFYDAITKILLGYKESSKDYVINTNTEFYLIINYRKRIFLKRYNFRYNS